MSENSGQRSNAPQPSDAPKRVLIVDDNVDAADLIALLLQTDGYHAEAAYSSSDALARAQTLKPEIVLLDIGLPEMDGYEVALRLRSLPGLGGMRLIALTGYGQASDRARTLAAGFDDHLVKPVDILALKRSIAGLPDGVPDQPLGDVP